MRISTTSLIVSLLCLSGCQTVGNGIKAVGEFIAPSAGEATNGIKAIVINPWPILGAGCFILGMMFFAIFRDRQTGFGLMSGGIAMGLIGVAFEHPYAPLTGLILIVIAIGYKIHTHLKSESSFD